MSGYVFVVSPCCSCRKVVSFNPNLVPSLRINGMREALCEDCFNRWNAIHRVAKGLEIMPLHPDAYSPCPM